jgi:hypothetical protein
MEYLFFITCAVIIILISVHAVISRRKCTPEYPGGKAGHWTYTVSLLISGLLLLIYIVGVAGVYFSGISWPHVGSMQSIVLFLLVPGFFFQSFFLCFSLVKRKLPDRRIRARILSVLLGLFAAAQIGQTISTAAMQRFTRACQPLVSRIANNLPAPCTSQSSYTALLPPGGAGSRWHLWHDTKSFVLTFPGGSADIDGSTIYYSSQQGKWTIFHNDSTEKSKKLEKLTQDMKECHTGTDS